MGMMAHPPRSTSLPLVPAPTACCTAFWHISWHPGLALSYLMPLVIVCHGHALIVLLLLRHGSTVWWRLVMWHYGYPYPHPSISVPVSTGMGLAQVWVRVQPKLPVGYPCYALFVVTTWIYCTFLPVFYLVPIYFMHSKYYHWSWYISCS